MPVSIAATSCFRARASPSLLASIPTSAIILRFLLRKILNIRSDPMLPETMTATLRGIAYGLLSACEWLDEVDRDGAEDTEICTGHVAASDRYHGAQRARHDHVARMKFQPLSG